MKIGLIGYGKMGKEIEKIAISRGNEIGAILDVDKPVSDEELQACDVVIEFTRPEAAVNNITRCLKLKVPIVVGTTGWYDHYDAIEELALKTHTPLFCATNFSVGVNIFAEINERLAQLMSTQDAYTVAMEETHHIHKLDHPSGTAITLAEGVIDNHPRLSKWVDGHSENASELGITSFREGEVPGTHTIKYQSEIDEIVITHRAHNRKGFALGAVLAAEFLPGKKGIKGMKDLLSL